MKIIGISAKIGAGKDTAHQVLAKHYESQGLRCTKLSFAKPLKDICTMLFGWDRERLEWDFPYKEGNTLDDGSIDPACEMLGKTRRETMQELGTDAMRYGLHKDVWIIALRLAIDSGDYDQYDYGFIPDCRFINELQFVKDMGGTCMKVTRHGEVTTLSDKTSHISELEWEQWADWDVVVENRIYKNMTAGENKEYFLRELLQNIDW